MNAIELAQSLVVKVEEYQFSANYNTELELEKDIYALFRCIVTEKVATQKSDINGIITTHGDTKEDKKRWSKTKKWQDVIIAGCKNTSDIVIKLSDTETVVTQLKYAKTNITGAIQAVIGQCVIATLKHSAVIGIVISKQPIKHKESDRLNELIQRFKQDKIFLCVREI